VKAAMSSPSSMVVVLWKNHLFFFRSFWFSSLELTINNEMVVYF
jgi:hypothetical protein